MAQYSKRIYDLTARLFAEARNTLDFQYKEDPKGKEDAHWALIMVEDSFIDEFAADNVRFDANRYYSSMEELRLGNGK